MLVGTLSSPTVVRRVHAGGHLDCPWRHRRVAVGACQGCDRLVAFEYRDGALAVHCRCPQSDAVNDPAWRDAV
jgi:hypothetical protein